MVSTLDAPSLKAGRRWRTSALSCRPDYPPKKAAQYELDEKCLSIFAISFGITASAHSTYPNSGDCIFVGAKIVRNQKA